MNGTTIVRKILFETVDTDGVTKKPVPVVRNHRYLVQINPAPEQTDITWKLIVDEWNAVDTVNVKPTQKVAPELDNFTAGFEPDADSKIAIDAAEATFTFDAVNPWDTDDALVPEPEDAEAAAADPDFLNWLTVSMSEPVVVTKALTGYKRTYTVTAAELATDGTRRSMLLIRNKANVTAHDTLHISPPPVTPPGAVAGNNVAI